MRGPLRSLLVAVVALTVVSQFVGANEFEYTVEVPPSKYECFFLPITNEKHKVLEIDYQVIDGADLNVNFMLSLGPEMLAQDHKKTDGSHRVEIRQLGDYQICFDNTFSYQSRKVVFFEIYLFDKDGNSDDTEPVALHEQDAKLQKQMEAFGTTVAVFNSGANKIKGALNKIEYYQALMRAYEARDRAIMAANFDRVTFWSLANTIVMLAVGAVQVFMIRSLFEERSKVGRMLRK